jgi:hypothetical protein
MVRKNPYGSAREFNVKGNVKLSMQSKSKKKCLTNSSVHHEIVWGSGCIYPQI